MIKLVLIFFFTQIVWAQNANLVGHWKFDDPSNLTLATVGPDLVLVGSDSAITGPAGDPGAVHIPTGSHYKFANPMGTLVDEFSIQMDFRIPSLSWTSIYQTDSTNTSDGDTWVTGSGAVGVGATGYSDPVVFPRSWQRIIISVNNTDTSVVGHDGFYRIYLNGSSVLDGVPQPDSGRFSLRETILWAADNNEEDGPMDVGEIRLYDGALSDADAESIGGYSLLTGQWAFNDTLALDHASVGTDLEFVGAVTAIPGPFPLDGAVNVPMESYMIATHGMDPQASLGDKVNEYTIVMDVMIPELGSWHILWQTDSTNVSDGDLAIRPTGEIGISATGYTYNSFQMSAGEWYRIAISAESGSRYDIYVDGDTVLRGTPDTLDGRFSLESTILFAADDNGDDAPINISNISVYQKAFSDQDIADFGGYPHVSGNTLVGHWTFDDVNNQLAATVGNDLVLVGTHELVEGPAFGNLGTRIGIGSHYRALHAIDTLISSGSKVNMYTIVMDFRVPALGAWGSLFQIDTSNLDDLDCGVRPTGEIGIGDTGYTYDLFQAEENEWYRVVIAVLNGLRYDFYINGELIMVGDVQSADGRFSLDPEILFFADENEEDATIDVAEIMMYNVYLSPDSIAGLGGPGGVLGIDEKSSGTPIAFKLNQNYPNPFNPTTTIDYIIPSDSKVEMVVYNMLGQKVRTLVNGYEKAGTNSVNFDGSNLASGIYFFRLTSGNNTQNRKMLLLK